MQITCLDLNYQTVDLLVFTFSDINFSLRKVDNGQLYEIGDNVKYLKIAYSTLEELSLLHLFLVQHRQEKLGLGNVKIIIIDNYYNPKNNYTTIIDEYWLNIATLSVQIGFNVLSISKEDPQDITDKENKIIVYSLLPNFDICEIEACFGNFDDAEYTFANLKLPSGVIQEENENTFLILLQYISMKIHKWKDYSHFLPMTLAYNAFRINTKIEEQLNLYKLERIGDYKKKLEDSFKFLNSQLSVFQQVYQEPESYLNLESQVTNYFKLPLHLLIVFKFKDNNRFIFQQMCDISYLFKAEFFCIYQQYNNLKNAVISQSSRSGKSVTILSVYYFNILTKQKIPVYINLAYNDDLEDGKIQPLYDETSIQMKYSMLNMHDYFYKPNIEYTNYIWIQKVIQESLKYQVYFEQVYNLIRQSFNIFDLDISHDKFLYIFNNIKMSSFTNYVDNYTSFINQIYPEFNSFKVKAVNVKISPQSQKENLTIKNLILDNVKNKDRQIIILVDEVLQQQKGKFNQCFQKVKLLTEYFSAQIIHRAKGCLKTILLRDNFLNENYSQISEITMTLLEIPFNIKELYDNQSQNIEKIILKVNQIYKNNEEDKYFLKFLSLQFFLIEAKIDEIINFMCITSPNFLNLRSSSVSLEIFTQYCSQLNEFGDKHVFKQCLFKFIMQLYNPRGIETIFWRNMYFALNTIKNSSHHQSFYNDLQKYFTDDNLLFEAFIQRFPIALINDIIKEYQQHEIFRHSTVHFLSSGTDLALINFVSQHELLYTSASSRTVDKYIQSHIFSGVQPHSSLLRQQYYQNSTISLSDWDVLKNQVDLRISNQNILQFYQLLVPELASEVQLVCPLISPQIIIAEPYKVKNLVTNSVCAFQYNVNLNTHDIKIINSYTQIINSLQIIRQNKKIILQSSQLDKWGNEQIYADNLDTINFAQKLFISTSMQFNQDIVFYFFYKASQNFQSYISYDNNQEKQKQIQQQAQLSRLSLKYSTISEITAILFFIIHITEIDITQFKEFLNIYEMKNLYLELVQITRNLDKTVQKSEYIHPDQSITNLKKYFKNAEFMFLQPCLDFISSIWDNEKLSKMDKLFEHLYKVLATCYQSLVRLQCILPFDDNVNDQLTYQPFIIAVPIDKNKLYNKFQVDSTVADFLVAFFPGSQQASDDLKQQSQFYKQHIENINNEKITFYTCIVESGLHIKEVLAEKAEINHNYVFQVTPYIGQQYLEKQPNTQYLLINRTENDIQLFIGSLMDPELGLQKQTQEQNDFITNVNKQHKINLLREWHQRKIEQNLKLFYIRFNPVFLNIFELFFKKEIKFDDTCKEYCIYLEINLEDYLKDQNLEFYYIKFQQSIQLANFKVNELTIDIQQLIRNWVSHQRQISNNQVPNIQTLLDNYYNIDNNFIKCKVSGNTFTMNINQLLSQLHNKIIAGGTVYVINNDEIKLSSEQITLAQVIFFLNKNNLIILGFEGLLTNLYQVKDCPYFQHNDDSDQVIVEEQVQTPNAQIQHWFNKSNQHTTPVIENYFNLFKLIEFDDKIASSADLKLFSKKMTIKKQFDQIFKIAKKADKFRIKFVNLKTQQIEKQKGIDIEILIQSQQYQVENMLKLLGRRVILSSEYKDNIVILKVVKASICQYCDNIDKSCLVVCQDCGEHLCQEHIQKHRVEFEHFQYKNHDYSVFHPSQSNSVVEEPVQKNTKAVKISPLQTIKQWVASYPKPCSAEVDNYLKLFANLTEESVKKANLKLFAEKNTVEQQVQEAINKATLKAEEIQLKFVDFSYDKILNTTTLDKPTKETVLSQLVIHNLVFVKYQILELEDSARIELMCLNIE